MAGRLWWDGARLKLPLLGDALLKAETARFARAMGTLVAIRCRWCSAWESRRRRLNNKTISGALAGVAMGVKRGEGIAAPMRKAGVFPPLAAHLLTVGEETGHLDQMFSRMAEIYETDTRASITALHFDFRAGGDPGDGRADRRADSEYAAGDYEY